MTRPTRALLDVAAGRPVSEPIDPDATIAAASAHGMSGLLWTRARGGDLDLPRRHSLQLAAADVVQRDHHRRLLLALERATALLDEHGIASATFKGVLAERRWYTRAGERPCADVDLLLAPGDHGVLAAAVDVLDPSYVNRAGLTRRVELGAQQAATVTFDGVSLDLHVEVPKFGVPSRAQSLLWAHVTTEALDSGAAVRVLDAEGHLFAFMAHVLKDRFARLLGLVDICRVAATPGLDWDAVAAIAAVDHLEAPLARVLGVVRDTLDVDLPSPWPEPRRGALAWSALCRPSVRLSGETNRPRRLLLVPFVIPGRRGEVVQSLARRALPRRDVARDLYVGRSSNPVTRLRGLRRTRK